MRRGLVRSMHWPGSMSAHSQGLGRTISWAVGFIVSLLLTLSGVGGCEQSDEGNGEGAERVPLEADSWQQVQELARQRSQCRGDMSQLLAAVENAPVPPDQDYHRLVDGSGSERGVLLSIEDLEPQRREALEALRRYRTTAGGCDTSELESLRPLQLLALGRLAIVTARGEDDLAQIEDALYLARQLRSCGTLVFGNVGYVLATEAAQWTVQRGVASPDLLRRYAPEREQALGIMARDAVATVARVRTALDENTEEGREERARWIREGVIFFDEEIHMLQTQLTRRVLASAQSPGDLQHMANVYSEEPDSSGLLTGTIARTLLRGVGHIPGELERMVALYETTLASSQPPTSSAPTSGESSRD